MASSSNNRFSSVLWRRAGIALHVLLFVLLAVAGSIAAVSLLGVSRYGWHGFEVELRLLPAAAGQTRIVFIPLGEVHAHTHSAPVAVVATLVQVQVDAIRSLLNNPHARETFARDFETTARHDLGNFILRQLVCASLGGLAAPILLRSRKVRYFFIGAAIGLIGMSAMLGGTLKTFNGRAFETPGYTGALKEAPWIIQFGKDAFSKIDVLSAKLRTVADNLNVLYGRIASLPTGAIVEDSPDTIRVLHVSDIHNNPAALPFIREVAHQFRISVIVDTGDLTDFGSPPETLLVQEIGKLPYPYVFVLGNHDSAAVADALKKQSNVTLLNGAVESVCGLTFLGLPNPAAARPSVGSVDASPDQLKEGGERLLALESALPIPPDIIAVHDPAEAAPLLGHVPLVLVGHEHRYYVDEAGDASLPVANNPSVRQPAYRTVSCNAGTTGAAGLRYFEKEKGVPFSCAVLTFRRAPQAAHSGPAPAVPARTAVAAPPPSPLDRPQLQSIDLIVLSGSFGEYSISHYAYH